MVDVHVYAYNALQEGCVRQSNLMLYMYIICSGIFLCCRHCPVGD